MEPKKGLSQPIISTGSHLIDIYMKTAVLARFQQALKKVAISC